MKNFTNFILLLLFTISCTVTKEPVFLKVDDLKLVGFAADTIKVNANAFFENPNDVGGKISTDAILVFVNGEEVAQVTASQFNVPARKEFTVPLFIKIPTKKIFQNNKNGLFGGLLNSVLNNKIKVQLKGNLKYSILGFKKDFLIDTTQDINIK